MAMQGIYRVEGRNEVFVLEDDKWRYVCTEAVLFQAGYSWDDVQVIPVAEWCKYEVGYPMPGGWADPSNYGYFPHSAWYVEQCAVPPPPPPPPTYTCPHCGAILGSQAELDDHIAAQHPPTPPPPPPSNEDWTARQIQTPIIAWGGAGPGDHSGFARLQQAGINILGGTQHPVTDLDWWRQLAQTAAQYQIGIMPWAGRGMAGRDDWGDPTAEWPIGYGERLRPEWETWVSMLAEQPSLYGFYAWEEPNVFRQMYGEPTPESMLEQYEALKRLAPEAKVTGTIGLAEPQYAMNYPQTMDVVFPEWFVNPGLGTEYWTSQYHRLWEPMLREFEGEVYPFILPSAIDGMSIEEILAGWEALQGPVTGLCYYGGLSNILQQVTEYNLLLRGYTIGILTHACGAKIQCQVSSVAAHNVVLVCPYDGASLGVKGVSGSAVITNIDEMASKLQGEIAALDNKLAELQGRIETLRVQVAETKGTLGV